MIITNVEVKKIENNSSKFKGVATVYLNDCFVIKNIRIIDGSKGLFIAMPNRLIKGKRVDICNPLNQETRKLFEDAILNKYKEI